MLDAAERFARVDVADDHQRRVVRHVEPPVVAIQVIARHGLQIRQPANRRMTVWVRLECGRRQLLIEQLIRVVLASLQLRDDDVALRLAVVRVIEAARHALGLDEEHAIERVARRGFEICRLVDPRVAVPRPAELLDDALHLVARDVRGALEVHVLAPVRHAGQPRSLVLGSDLVPAPDRRERRGAFLLDQDLQAVIERQSARCRVRPSFRGSGHPFIIKSLDTHA